MILSVKRSITVVVLLSAVTAASLQTAVAASTSDRLDSLERKLDSRGLLDMLNRVEQMQRDIQQLRGDIEVQTHTLKDMQRHELLENAEYRNTLITDAMEPISSSI